ncbi:cyclin-D3-2-like [Lolium rigidum]|uniref:cyclin-D3-2-like n=1 Tax=Lolium rigidum TaxID=89674 RepID=UPI001F5CE695|nr:cyclin-D3-2-like [Lolium rigidum]
MAFAALFADSLFCSEERLDDLFQEPAQDDDWPEPPAQQQPALDDELPALFEAYRRKEEPLPDHGERYGGNAGREAAVGWATRAAARLGFSALTAALATAYLDRCFLGAGGAGGGAMRLGDQPWKARLAAVACVALAAKVEETRVPLLLDLQLLAAGPDPDAGAAAYVFDSDTMYRMEAIVLNELAWRMHPVTPFSFLHPVLAAARLRHCEALLLAAMTDWRWPRHRPSAWAAAALCVTAAFGTGDGDADLLALINAPEDEVAECAKILTGEAGFVLDNKRKRAPAGLHSPPLSPIGVIGSAAYFSRESSTSSADAVTTAWPGCVSVSSSPDPAARPLKRATAMAMIPPDEESRDAWP